VDTVYRLGPPEPAPLTENASTLDRLTGRIGPEAPGGPFRFAVAPNSVQLAGTLLARGHRLALYRIEQPLRLATLLEGVYADGWMVTDAAFTRYAVTGGRPARLRVRISREAWDGPSDPGRVTIRVGPLSSQDGQPALRSVTSSTSWTVRSGAGRTFVLKTPQPPFRVEIHTSTTFSPGAYGRPDTRQLGAQVELGVITES
jgi:hypothetical protein